MAQAHLGPNQTFEFVNATANQVTITDPEIGQHRTAYRQHKVAYREYP